jgi:TrmH family RNA methyltransferase
MISKSDIQLIRKLELRKYRDEQGLFVAEGSKLINSILGGKIAVQKIYGTREWIALNKANLPVSVKVQEITQEELNKISFLKNPHDALALCTLPNRSESVSHPSGSPAIALDAIQDPGNLGTILRIADWFGIDTLYCSPDCADAFAPKTVQGSMGAVGSVKIITMPLEELFAGYCREHSVPVYGFALDGADISDSGIQKHGIILLGNEGKGISENLKQHITCKLLIPGNPLSAESLNVASAAAIACYEMKKK